MCSNCSGEYENPDETNPAADEPLEDAIGQDVFQATLAVCFANYKPACQHEHRRINLSTAWLECLDCNEPLLDLDPCLSQSLRIARNL